MVFISDAVRVNDEENVDVQTGPRGVKSFAFERAFAPAETQEDVFEEVAPILTSVLDGFNGAILAYGQTGSGKTHTMIGGAGGSGGGGGVGGGGGDGIIPKSAKYIFDAIEERQKEGDLFDLRGRDGGEGGRGRGGTTDDNPFFKRHHGQVPNDDLAGDF